MAVRRRDEDEPQAVTLGGIEYILVRARHAPEQPGLATTAACPSLEEFSQRYLTVAALTNKPSVIDTKRQILRDHLLPRLGALQLDAITGEQIDLLQAELLKTHSAKTVNNVSSLLRTILKYAARKARVISSATDIEHLRTKRGEKSALSEDEASRLVEAADPEWRAMIAVAVWTGLRVGELRALRWSDVDLDAGEVTVQRALYKRIEGTPKGHESVRVPLAPVVVEELRRHEHHAISPYIWCSENGEPYSRGKLKWPMYRACDRAALPRRGHWHRCRHTFATVVALHETRPAVVQRLLRHTDIRTTMRYVHVPDEDLRGAVRELGQSPKKPTDPEK